MPQLHPDDIQTREVLDWQGIHLLHFSGSSCSQKTRIFLGVKGIEWQSHLVNLPKQENYSEWFMGINPRGLVPVLVDDGKVIIESNDILEYLDAKFPEIPLIPDGKNQEAHELLVAEDELHLDLRTLTMRYVFPSAAVIRSQETLQQYSDNGSGNVQGSPDAHKAVELDFWRGMLENDGITDDQVRTSVERFRAAYDDLNSRLKNSKYLLGEALSLIDIAWYIYSVRLQNAGYPITELHPAVGKWFEDLHQRPEFAREVEEPMALRTVRKTMHAAQALKGTSLARVAGL